ncbi:MAG: hypothetical protein Q9225_006753 [Loekoesia sp. 1 TL-2023]
MTSQTESRPLWLLLLPSPPENITSDSIRAAYASTISQVLRKTADISSSFATVTTLDIALPCPDICSPSAFRYSYLQNLLRQLYRLICLLCGELYIDVQYDNDVDVRILLFQASSLDGSRHAQTEVTDDLYTGPIISLRRLASCSRLWQRVCSMHSENGEILLQLFLRLRSSSPDNINGRLAVERISPDRSLPTFNEPALMQAEDEVPRAHHKSVAVGGTFDHLHIGHKLLLSMTALVLSPAEPYDTEQNRSIIVGITGDKLLENKKFRECLQNWHQRQAAVQTFLQAFLVVEAPSQHVYSDQGEETDGTHQRVVSSSWLSGLIIRYVEIFDAFGPTITDEAISALVLSEETRAGGKAVNEKRAEKGWQALDIFEVDVLDSSDKDARGSDEKLHDFQNKISSTEIRRRLGKRSGTAD